MKKIAIISILLLSILGLSFQYMNGQSRKIKQSHQSISHSIDNDNEIYSKSDEEGTVEIERKKGRLTKLVINGKEISSNEFSKYKTYVDNLLNEIPSAPEPPIPPMPPVPPMPPAVGGVRWNNDRDFSEADFEVQMEELAQERKAYLQEMYEEKARIINEAIEVAQVRKRN